MHGRLLIVGWDGATWNHIRPLLKQAELPNLARLVVQGAHTVLRSTTPYWSNIAWPSLVTGLWPGKTGTYDGLSRQSRKYTSQPTNLTGYRGVRLWHWVNRYGKSAGVINLPMTYPASPQMDSSLLGLTARGDLRRPPTHVTY